MKYWRGYLVAALFSAFGWGLTEFAKGHVALMDMVYPYMSRMIVTSMSEWSSGVDFCVWQVLLIALAVLLIATAVLMIILKWNPIQWFGWVAAVASIVYFLNLAVFGLNVYSGDLADDIRLEQEEYSIAELEKVAVHYRDLANQMSGAVKRNTDGTVKYDSFAQLAQQAGNGFYNLTYKQGIAVFAGSTQPVKELGLSHLFPSTEGLTVGITGESAVNPDLPDVMLPVAMCREMAVRMSITPGRDADYAAFLAWEANESEQFRYSGYLLAYRYCVNALENNAATSAKAAAQRVRSGESKNVSADLAAWDAFGSSITYADADQLQFHDMLVSRYIQVYVLPLQIEEKVLFDPMDESQVDLTTTIVDTTEEEE